jgi:hypothetical protein
LDAPAARDSAAALSASDVRSVVDGARRVPLHGAAPASAKARHGPAKRTGVRACP